MKYTYEIVQAVKNHLDSSDIHLTAMVAVSEFINRANFGLKKGK